MERPHKRFQIDNMDPSLPLEDGRSPFLEASHKMIDLIFQTLTVVSVSVKEKMRLELVCQKFQSRIKERSSWQHENKVVLSSDDKDNILINGFKFSFEKAPSALFKLLDRITLQVFVLTYMSDMPPEVHQALCNAIVKHKDFVTLRCIQLDGLIDYTPIITALSDCGLEKVVEIECGDWNNETESDRYTEYVFIPSSFFSMLSNCHNLKIFILAVDQILPIWETLFSALANSHHLTQMSIDSKEEKLTCRNTVEFAQFCSSNFPKLNNLRFYYKVVPPAFKPLDFINSLSDQIRSNITRFGFTLNAGVPLHRECLKSIYRYFPKLNILNMLSVGAFPTETILEAIENIFTKYNNHEYDETEELYEFVFHVTAENRGEVLYELAEKEWNEGEKFAKIEGENCMWFCRKDNVDITLLLCLPD